METTNKNRPLAAEKTLQGQDLYFSGDVAGALKLYVEAWELSYDAISAMNIAVALEHLGEFDKAFEWAERCHSMRPDDWRTRTCYGGALMREGRWAEAWQYWHPVIERPFTGGGEEWKPGMDLTGKQVLVVPAGGLGDVFMFSRFLPAIAKRFKCHVTWAATEDLVPVFLKQPSMATVNMTQKRDFQVWMHLFHIPLLLDLTPGGVAAAWNGPYIEPIELDDYELGNKIRVGIKFGAGEKGDKFKFRSVPGPVGEYLIRSIPKSVDLVALTMSNPVVHGWLDTIALMSTCDLVISVDTSSLHMAGAMGKETWALLGDFNDPKFGRGSECPWYPTMRIFRGEGKGYQHSVDQVLEALNTWLPNSRRATCRVATT